VSTLSETEGLRINYVTVQSDYELSSRTHVRDLDFRFLLSLETRISRCSFAGVNPEQSRRAQDMARNDKKKNICNDPGDSSSPVATTDLSSLSPYQLKSPEVDYLPNLSLYRLICKLPLVLLRNRTRVVCYM